jgi:O-antigen ligase
VATRRKTNPSERAKSATKPARDIPSVAESRRTGGGVERAIWLIVSGIVLLVPIAVHTGGWDRFRLPKDSLFILGTSLLLPLLAAGLFRNPAFLTRRWRTARPLWIVAAVIVWTLITTVASTNVALSLHSLLWVALTAVFFLATWFYAASRSVHALAMVVVPGAMNALILLLQAAGVWSPLQFDPETLRTHTLTALLGNPNEVGSFLVIATVIALGMTFTFRSHRWYYGAAAGLMFAAVVATRSDTALIALATGIVAFAFSHSRRMGVAIVLASVIAAGTTTLLVPPLRERVAEAAHELSTGQLEQLTSGRVTAFLTAGAMAADHPLTGVGPGCFGFRFFDYRPLVDDRYRHLLGRAALNFGEAHNDHLEIFAETGILGYLLFLTAVGYVMSRGGRRQIAAAESGRAAAGAMIALPLALSFSVLALGQFPLQLTAPTAALLYATALVCRWSQSS